MKKRSRDHSTLGVGRWAFGVLCLCFCSCAQMPAAASAVGAAASLLPNGSGIHVTISAFNTYNCNCAGCTKATGATATK